MLCRNTVLNGYASNGDLEACERLFEEMPERNVFSWNGLEGMRVMDGSLKLWDLSSGC